MKTYKQAMDILKQYVERVHNNKNNEASRALGLKDPSILSQWLNGVRSPRLNAIAPVLDIIGARLLPPNERLLEYEFIPKHSAKAGAGGSLETSDETEGLYAFRKDWLWMKNIHADKAVLLPVVGDSMEPLLKEGDTLLVDKNATELMDGHVYVVTLGEELKVKRIYRGLNGIILRSDNQRYPDVNVEGPDLETLQIWGRVRWVGKEL